MKLVFGSEDSEYIRATFGTRPYSEGIDRNWVNVGIDLVVLPFRAAFGSLWRVETLPMFRSDLERAYDTLEGTAQFRPDWEGSLSLDLEGDGLGHFSVTGDACPDAATGPWLRFRLPTIDQTYLPDLIRTFTELEAEYPSE